MVKNLVKPMFKKKQLIFYILFIIILNCITVYISYLLEKRAIDRHLLEENKKILNITIEKIELSKNLLEHLSNKISREKYEDEHYISEVIKEAYNIGYDIGSYKGVKSSGIYWFCKNQIIGKNGKISNDRLHQIFKNSKYPENSPSKVFTINNYYPYGMIISLYSLYDNQVKGSINLMLTDYAIKDLLDRVLDINTEYAVSEGADNLAFTSEGLSQPFYNINNFSILNILKNEEKIYASLLKEKINNVEYTFLAGNDNSVIIEKLVKYMIYAFIFTNTAIIIFLSIYKLTCMRVENKIKERYKDDLCFLKNTLDKVEVEYSVVKKENKIINNNLKTLSISSSQNHVLTKKLIFGFLEKLDDIRFIIDVFIRSINGDLQVTLTPQKEIQILSEVLHKIDNFFLKEINYSDKKSDIKNITDKVSKIYTNHLFDNDIELNIQYKGNLEDIYIDALSLKCVLITMIMYSLRGLGQEGKIDLILSIETINKKKCLKIDLTDNGFGLDLNNKLIKEDTNFDDKTLGPLSILIPTVDKLKEMICKVNGHLDYVSKLNRGLSFKVLIPIQIVNKTEKNKSKTKESFDNVTYLFSKI